jgi:methyl-accepting chemotaxis protein
MEQKEFDTAITTRILKAFLGLYAIHPTLYFISVVFAIGITQFFSIFKIILILAPPIILTFTVLFFRRTSILTGYIRALLADPKSVDMVALEKFIGHYPGHGFLLLLIGCAGGPVLTVILGLYLGVLNSIYQAFFLFLVGELTAVAAGAIIYYIIKTELYPFTQAINYKPLTMFHKFSIPIISAIMVLFTIISIGIYRISYSNNYERRTEIMRLALSRTASYVSDFYSKAALELESYAKTDVIKGMQFGAIDPFLRALHQARGDQVEMYFIAEADGSSINSLNTKANISDRPYFKSAMTSGKPSFSDPIISRASNREIIACAVPVLAGGRIAGVMGLTITIETAKAFFKSLADENSVRFVLVSKDNKVIMDTADRLLNKTFAVDLIDDGANFQNTQGLLVSSETLTGSVIEGISHSGFTVPVPAIGGKLVLLMPTSDFFFEMNMLLLQISLFLLVISLIITLMIFNLTRRISKPLHNTIEIFKSVANGDLTVSSTDFLPDEFGELIRYLKLLLRRLREFIQISADSSGQLTASSSNLAATSQDLAQNAQTQAASVEQASASLEEISSSIDQIAQNAMNQSDFAKATFQSMKELKNVIKEVATHAEEALQKANSSSDEALKGNELMQNTIAGMNNIDESTKKIAEIVSLIGDISDQVNLLALNAAIEAARAGDHGRGFAVVADEIGKLADETAQSAKTIARLVQDGLNEVRNGRQYVDATSRALDIIINNVHLTDELVNKIAEFAKSQERFSDTVLADTRRVMEMADSISAATSEQMTTNKEMTSTVDQINEITQSLAASAEEIASSAEEINAQTESLNAHIEFFKVKS